MHAYGSFHWLDIRSQSYVLFNTRFPLFVTRVFIVSFYLSRTSIRPKAGERRQSRSDFIGLFEFFEGKQRQNR